jgi:competence protein ComEC
LILANRHHIWLFAAAYTAGILLAGQMPQHQILPAILILAGIGAVCYLHPAKKECVILALLLSGAVLSGFGLTRHQAMQYTKRVSLAEQHMETSVRISGILTQKQILF